MHLYFQWDPLETVLHVKSVCTTGLVRISIKNIKNNFVQNGSVSKPFFNENPFVQRFKIVQKKKNY